MQVLGMGWNAIKGWAKSMVESHPWSLFEAAKANDASKLRVRSLAAARDLFAGYI